MTAVIAQKYGLKFDINFCNNSSSWLPFCLKIWSLLTLFKTNIRWILFSSLIIYLFILIKWVLISLGKQTLRWYMRHGIYLCHHLEIQILLIVSWLVAMQTVLHVEWIIFIGENLHVPSPCIWVNLTLTLLTRWKLIILSNSDPWKLRRVCNFKIFLWQVINFQLHQLIINNSFGRLLEPWTHTYLNIFKLIFFLPKSNLN